MVKRCVACLNKESPSINISFHRFPVDKNLQQIWLQALNRTDLTDVSNKRVCYNHFDSSSFAHTQAGKKNGALKNTKRLKHGAIPMNLTTPVRFTDSSTSVATQTDLDFNGLSDLFQKLSLYEEKLFNTTICIERFRNDDMNIRYFTGFRSYTRFKMVFELLEVKFYRTNNLCCTNKDVLALI
jgi:hypothetical protein